jgi:phosphohistidine phosphatase
MSGDTLRRLVLLRHAKSDWPDMADHERPLAKRGRHAAPAVGIWLRDRGYVPDVVVCSTAKRTRQTWDLVAGKLDGSPEVRYEERAYGASVQTLLYLAHELPDSCRTALFIGHNPGIGELASALPGQLPDASVGGLRFPTAAVAVLEFTGDWPDLAPGTARLAAYTVPAAV